MKLTDYQWSRNPRGMHNQGRPDLNKMLEQKLGIVKLVALGDEYVDLARSMMASNITPIIRIYRPQHSGVPVDAQMESEFRRYLEAGIKWFEIYNEPNLPIEWPSGANYDPMNTEGVIKPICDNWLDWAELIVSYGAYPGFIPLSDADGDWENTGKWITQLLKYMHDVHRDRFSRIIFSGMWLGTHPYIYNHFYQEMPNGGPLSARPPEIQNYAEGGWHFEYPYDPITQQHDPGVGVWGGTPLNPRGDLIGLTASGRAWLERLNELFGVPVLPVIGSEGGLWPLPPKGNQIVQPDPRFPGFTWESHAHATVAMFNWISSHAPPWFWGVALWKWDHFYEEGGGGPMPAAALMAGTSTPFKEVPPIEIGEYGGEVIAQPPPISEIVLASVGPGPLHGQPTHHFIVLAPGLSTEWFFSAARVYWERFSPDLLTFYDFINFLPPETSLAVTALTYPHEVDVVNDQIKQRWPNIYLDLIVSDNLREIEELLNSRVAANRRFG